MNEAGTVSAVCPGCGKRLRIKSDIADEPRRRRAKFLLWLMGAFGIAVAALLVYVTFLWIGVRSEARTARDEVVAAEEKFKETVKDLNDKHSASSLRQANAERKAQALTAEFGPLRQHLISMQKRNDSLENENAILAKLLADCKKELANKD